jgi:hypothetical protein
MILKLVDCIRENYKQEMQILALYYSSHLTSHPLVSSGTASYGTSVRKNVNNRKALLKTRHALLPTTYILLSRCCRSLSPSKLETYYKYHLIIG